MGSGDYLVQWFIGSIVAWIIWIAMGGIVTHAAGSGMWLLMTAILALADLFLFFGIVREMA